MGESRRIGTLYGVGLGPGDPELVTLKARRVIEASDVIAYPTAGRGAGVARQIADPYLRSDQVEIPMVYPITTGETDGPGGYDAALRAFYDRCAQELGAHLDRGRTVAVLCEGDPFLYGSYMYLHERLAATYPTEVVPGVTSFSAAAAAAGTPLAKRDDTLVIVPGTLPAEDLMQRLHGADAAVILKLGRRFASVREATEEAGCLDRAIYVERASSTTERIAQLRDVSGEAPYMSLVLVPSRSRANHREPEAEGEVAVVGLGPAGREWRTLEAQEALVRADDIVGYAPYLERVPARDGQARHASDNRDELERASLALRLAASGRRVAVVSSGDPGIFAMASTVLEAVEAEGSEFAEVRVRVVPGLSAMQAAAARVGAPLGHDFCVISLSDRLKPWSIIEKRLQAAGEADLVVALYNPASHTRRQQLERARTVLLAHRARETPVVIARDVGGNGESVAISTLGGLDCSKVDMRTILLVGSSMTRLIESADGETRVYTPRSYPA